MLWFYPLNKEMMIVYNLRKYIITLFFIGSSIFSYGQITSTIAGKLGQKGKQDGLALNEATFNSPHGIAVSQNGEIFIADRYNHIIRKIDVNGVVSTVAGTGISGKQDGIATEATFKEPWGLAVDNLGNVYVADTKNNKIRKITPNGTVSTFAGTGNLGITDSNNPLLASFGEPTDLVFDKKGNLYVADHRTHLIRKITPSGAVSTLAGNRNYPTNYGLTDGLGQLAKFYRPYGLDIDDLGNIYVADEWNHAIRKISPLGTVITLAGNGILGSNNGTGSSATFNYPFDVAVDSTGKIYVSDGLNYLIRVIDLSNNVAPFVGLLVKQGSTDGLPNVVTLNGVTSIAFNKDQSALFFADTYSHLIRKIVFTRSIESPTIRFQNINSTLDSVSSCLNSKLDLFISGGYDSYDVYLDSALLLNTTESVLDLSSLPVGQGQIYLIGKKDGYTSKSSNPLKYKVIKNNSAKILASKKPPYCFGDSIALFTDNKSNVLWNTSEINDSIKIKNSGKYFLSNTPNECYSSKDTIDVLFNSKPIVLVNASKPMPYIEGETVYLIASGAKSYLWNNLEKTDRLLVRETGKYIVQGTDLNTCTNYSDTINIVFEPFKNVLKVNLLNGDSFCANDSTKISANIKSPVNWYLNDQKLLTTDSVLTVKKNGRYYFSYQTNNQSIYYSNTVVLKTIAPPVVDIQSDRQMISDLANKVQFEPNISTLKSYFWDFGDGSSSKELNPMHEYNSIGKYSIKLHVEDLNGCKTSLTKTNFISYTPSIFIANSFTPNNDLVNDEIVLRGIPNEATVDFKIFNEWGELVFFSTSNYAIWNGKYKNEIANQGNYAYVLKVSINEEVTIFKGIITLIK